MLRRIIPCLHCLCDRERSRCDLGIASLPVAAVAKSSSDRVRLYDSTTTVITENLVWINALGMTTKLLAAIVVGASPDVIELHVILVVSLDPANAAVSESLGALATP